MHTTVISLGGSMIIPDQIDLEFLRAFKKSIESYLAAGNQRVVVITGGGKVCRRYQEASYKLVKSSTEERDWIGIASTRLNGELVRVLFGDQAYAKLLGDPSAHVRSSKKVFVAGGWEPGWSTDMDAVLIAKQYSADRIINVSNVAQVYTADPRKDANARPVHDVTWDEYLTFIPRKWEAGLSTPFDPEASRLAQKLGLSVVIIHGERCVQLKKVLVGKDFTGTLIHP